MDKSLRMNMANKRLCVFIEQLLQFGLAKRGIQWEPEQSYAQEANARMLFNEIIGNTVINISIVFQAKVQKHTENVLGYIFKLSNPVEFRRIHLKIIEVAREIYHLGDPIKNTYLFMAVMVHVSINCSTIGRQHLIQQFVPVMISIINFSLHRGLIHNFTKIIMYAVRNTEPPAN